MIRYNYNNLKITAENHVDLYLFDGVDSSYNFEVVEKWEKNG